MPHRFISLTIPANTNSVQLPSGTTVGATFEVEHDQADQQGLNIVQNPNNPEVANITSSLTSRQVTIKVEQDVPFFPTESVGVSNWKNKFLYKVGHHVFYQGRVYRCTVEHNPNGATYLDPNKWVNTSGDTGTIITVSSLMPAGYVPEGCWPLNGTRIDAPWSPLHDKFTPNMVGKVIVAAGGTSYVHGNTSGADSVNLQVANLPTTNISFSGNTGNKSAGTPDGSVTGYTTINGNHSHTLYSADGGSGSYIDHDKSGSSSGLQSYGSSISTNGDHMHSLVAKFTGNAMSEHQHSFSGSINLNTGTQAAISVRQPAMHFNMFVRL